VGDRVDLPAEQGRYRMFFGTYTPKLDEKGRLFLPAKFRDELTEGLVVTRGQERCLTVWSLEDFGRLTDRLREAPVTQKNTRDYVRMLFAAASQEVPDKQGRINIPAPLREYASLRKECVVIGSMNRIEIWDPTSWATYSEEQEQKFSELSDEVFPGI
jgi:MraZ protein